jgi:hypothetical protein
MLEAWPGVAASRFARSGRPSCGGLGSVVHELLRLKRDVELVADGLLAVIQWDDDPANGLRRVTGRGNLDVVSSRPTVCSPSYEQSPLK